MSNSIALFRNWSTSSPFSNTNLDVKFSEVHSSARAEIVVVKKITTQCNQPSKVDWVENIKKIISSIDLQMSFEDIRQTKQNAFKKIVDAKVRKVAFGYLLSKIKSKGKEINFGSKLQCQSYLIPNSLLTLQDQRAIFSF